MQRRKVAANSRGKRPPDAQTEVDDEPTARGRPRPGPSTASTNKMNKPTSIAIKPIAFEQRPKAPAGEDARKKAPVQATGGSGFRHENGVAA